MALTRIRPELSALNPAASFAAEIDTAFTDGEQWLVDPTDGVVQLVQGLPQWCLTATLLHGSAAVLTVIHNPVLAATYSAIEGGGAFRDGVRISPSRKTQLEISLVGTSHPPFQAKDPVSVAAAGRSLSSVLMVAGAVRNLGPTSWQIADVACGRMDAFWQYGTDDANLVGAALIAREAGAVVTDAGGDPWLPGAPSFLAAPAQLHGLLLAAIAQPTA